jgi:hypothetical protein
MKKTLLMLCLVSCCGMVAGQSFFNQKKTKLKYITEQIALLKVYNSYLKQGYEIVSDGWSLVNDIKNGDFDLHNNYFTSLKSVSSSIRNYSKAADIAVLQEQILSNTDHIKKEVTASGYVQADEKDYVNKVISNLLAACSANLSELQLLTTNDSLQLKDNERLDRINSLYTDMQDKYAFSKYFLNTVQLLELSRAKNENDIKALQLLYDIK